MIKLSEPSLPKVLRPMHPERLAIDAGFSADNDAAIRRYLKKMAKKTLPKEVEAILSDTETEPDFYSFFSLYDYAIKQDGKVRQILPDIGYSPYNVLLLINCLGEDKKSIARLLDWSFSKVSVNTTVRTSEYFMPMVGDQWTDFLRYFVDVLKKSDEQFGVKRCYSNIFYMVGNKSKPLKIPS